MGGGLRAGGRGGAGAAPILCPSNSGGLGAEGSATCTSRKRPRYATSFRIHEKTLPDSPHKLMEEAEPTLAADRQACFARLPAAEWHVRWICHDRAGTVGFESRMRPSTARM